MGSNVYLSVPVITASEHRENLKRMIQNWDRRRLLEALYDSHKHLHVHGYDIYQEVLIARLDEMTEQGIYA